MTQEEKAKIMTMDRYEEALKRAKEFVGKEECINLEYIFPELLESEDEKIRKAIVCGMTALKEQGKKTFAAININDCIAWLEKQGKTENGEVAEPKFKVGDWIVTPENQVRQITSILGTKYRFNNQSSYWEICYCDEKCRLWTLEDAQNGDVLAFDDETIVIFKDLYNATTFHSYCHIEDGIFGFNKYGDWWEGKGFHPATKEQRDILMKAIDDVGYKFDFKKKELKKIKEGEPAWSEENDSILNELIKYFESLLECVATEERHKENRRWLNWLKSFKDRYRWKPSEQQMKLLKEACDQHWEPDGLDPLYTLYQQLKKLM